LKLTDNTMSSEENKDIKVMKKTITLEPKEKTSPTAVIVETLKYS